MPSKKDFQRDIEEKENRIKELETEKLQAEKQSKQAFTQKQLELDEAQGDPYSSNTFYVLFFGVAFSFGSTHSVFLLLLYFFLSYQKATRS
jgi:hypothetical protein